MKRMLMAAFGLTLAAAPGAAQEAPGPLVSEFSAAGIPIVY